MIEVIRNIIDEQMNSYGLSDLAIGTVVSINPLKIKLTDRITLNENQILLTEFVLEKSLKLIHKHGIESVKISSYTHSHKIDGATEKAQEHTHSLDLITKTDTHSHKADITIKDNLGEKIIIQEGLKNGDKVIMLKTEQGQKYVVLSKVRDKKSVIIDCISGSWDWS
ncbi:DUF2577 domain-containing protein [Peptoanaerobacter stomatis]|uniref:DUF2577 domain-containing protein n=1 Tax=Peptoanaerobacter stomatis TaxID=796937 RepID=UPI003FA1759F